MYYFLEVSWSCISIIFVNSFLIYHSFLDLSCYSVHQSTFSCDYVLKLLNRLTSSSEELNGFRFFSFCFSISCHVWWMLFLIQDCGKHFLHNIFIIFSSLHTCTFSWYDELLSSLFEHTWCSGTFCTMWTLITRLDTN